jgi:ferredoxin-NADP reductase
VKDFIAVPVLAVLDESPSIRTFRMARPEGFAFQAGQFLTVRVQVDGQPHVRCYSISSAPEATGYLEISVKRQGLVSGTLHATVRPGSSLMVRPPAGKFVYPARDDRPIVLVAGGVGITPLISMLRHALVADPLRPVTLVYSARGARELAFWDELQWLARRHTQARVVATLTESDSAWPGRLGRIDGNLLAECVDNAAHALFMICGPAPMIDEVRHTLEAMGVPGTQIRSEVFQAAAAIGAKPQPMDADSSEPDTNPSGRCPRLRLVRSNRTIEVDPRQTLLEAAEAAHAPIPSLCRSGVCRTCRTRLVSGSVQCTSDALDDNDHADGYTLPCVAWARTDCSLDA